MEARPQAARAKPYTLADGVDTLRMSPDYLVIGEVRDEWRYEPVSGFDDRSQWGFRLTRIVRVKQP